jgi:menaquinone reductase, multiheme cytochrome c subunit
MSKDNDLKSSGVHEGDNASQHPHSPSHAQGGGAYIILFFIIGVAASMVLGWAIFPKLLYSSKGQPFDFNHKLHLEQVDDCASCHFFREDGSFSGSPTLAECIDCHSEKIGASEDEAIFVEQYVYKEREVPWLKYARQPDCVFFSHAAHTFGAKLECMTCHGDIGNSESLRPYQENRITGYSRDIWGHNIAGIKRNTSDRMKMDDCAQCHETAGIHDSSVQTGRDACFVCHK